MKIFTRFSLPVGCLFALFLAAMPAVSQQFSSVRALSAAQATTQKDAKSNAAPKKKSRAEIEREQFVARQAKRLLDDCRQKMEGKSVPPVETYRADIEQQITMDAQSFTATGRYIQGRGLQRRLELKLKFGPKDKPTTGELLQVCDGDILTTQQTVNGVPRVTRRKVLEILKVAKQIKPADEKTDRIAALGLGGIAGLISSLQMTMTFDKLETRTVGSTAIRVLEGGWNPQYTQQFAASRGKDGRLPSHVPERVRVEIDARSDAKYKDLIRRILYLKKEADGDTYRPLMSMTLRNIELNPPELTPAAEDKAAQEKLLRKYFTIVIPKNAFDPDVTDDYIKRLKAASRNVRSAGARR